MTQLQSPINLSVIHAQEECEEESATGATDASKLFSFFRRPKLFFHHPCAAKDRLAKIS